jgi:hypothetical protein
MVDLRARFTILVDLFKGCSTNECFIPPHEFGWKLPSFSTCYTLLPMYQFDSFPFSTWPRPFSSHSRVPSPPVESPVWSSYHGHGGQAAHPFPPSLPSSELPMAGSNRSGPPRPPAPPSLSSSMVKAGPRVGPSRQLWSAANGAPPPGIDPGGIPPSTGMARGAAGGMPPQAAAGSLPWLGQHTGSLGRRRPRHGRCTGCHGQPPACHGHLLGRRGQPPARHGRRPPDRPGQPASCHSHRWFFVIAASKETCSVDQQEGKRWWGIHFSSNFFAAIIPFWENLDLGYERIVGNNVRVILWTRLMVIPRFFVTCSLNKLEKGISQTLIWTL